MEQSERMIIDIWLKPKFFLEKVMKVANNIPFKNVKDGYFVVQKLECGNILYHIDEGIKLETSFDRLKKAVAWIRNLWNESHFAFRAGNHYTISVSEATVNDADLLKSVGFIEDLEGGMGWVLPPHDLSKKETEIIVPRVSVIKDTVVKSISVKTNVYIVYGRNDKEEPVAAIYNGDPKEYAAKFNLNSNRVASKRLIHLKNPLKIISSSCLKLPVIDNATLAAIESIVIIENSINKLHNPDVVEKAKEKIEKIIENKMTLKEETAFNNKMKEVKLEELKNKVLDLKKFLLTLAVKNLFTDSLKDSDEKVIFFTMNKKQYTIFIGPLTLRCFFSPENYYKSFKNVEDLITLLKHEKAYG